jgi:hypothetical protein
MKALEKDRARRYETANGLALDVQRFLADEVISARPPSSLYRFQKVLQRNKLLFTCVSLIAGFFVAGLIIVSMSFARERQSRRESQQVTLFLTDMLQGVGPSAARGRDTTMLREVLDRTAGRVNEMTNQPAVEAELRSLIGRVYLQIGDWNRAEEMNREALGIVQKLYGTESAQSAASLYYLGLTLWHEKKLPEAERAHQDALAIRRRLFGNENAAVADSLNDLASVYINERRLADAEALIRELEANAAQQARDFQTEEYRNRIANYLPNHYG